MRYHKSKMISAADAELLIEMSMPSLNRNVVILHNNKDWYDVRSMTTRELEDFVCDLLRTERAALQSGLIIPH